VYRVNCSGYVDDKIASRVAAGAAALEQHIMLVDSEELRGSVTPAAAALGVATAAKVGDGGARSC
jgi:hypothetical protein